MSGLRDWRLEEEGKGVIRQAKGRGVGRVVSGLNGYVVRVSSVSADDMGVCSTVTGRRRNGSRALISLTNRHVGPRRNRAEYRLLRYNRTGTFHSPSTTHTERCSLQVPHYIPHTCLSTPRTTSLEWDGFHLPPASQLPLAISITYPPIFHYILWPTQKTNLSVLAQVSTVPNK